jgi:hypothetical protein
MDSLVSTLVKRLDDRSLAGTGVIPWSSPVLSFGDLSRARVATLGLNPSNREFVDSEGNELDGSLRRFHTLTSLGLSRWSEARPCHLSLIAESCRAYFVGNPYDTWFKRLDKLIAGLKVSYYSALFGACHLDLVPYATAEKWTALTRQQREKLLTYAGDTLGLLLRESPVRVLILNGSSVIEHFEKVADTELKRQVMLDWTLRRRGGDRDVTGLAHVGVVRTIGGVRLRRDVHVLGFNHNIQSSFGVTTQVTESIQHWIARTAAASIL